MEQNQVEQERKLIFMMETSHALKAKQFTLGPGAF
jgi:hypothetical protein